ncbi:MAG: hypothetical protein VB130_16805 [Clostridium sp.]|nr:hypothetical protein [Clostridium sp.]
MLNNRINSTGPFERGIPAEVKFNIILIAYKIHTKVKTNKL